MIDGNINKDINDIAYKLAAEMEAEIETILEEIERVVKNTIPIKYVKSVLISLEEAIRAEGINCLFDKKVSEKTLGKIVNQKVEKDKIQEVVAELTQVVIEEIENVLRNVDENCDEIVRKIEDENTDKTEFEEDLKSKIELLIAGKDIDFKLVRNTFIRNDDIPSIPVIIHTITGKRRRIIILDELENENVF